MTLRVFARSFVLVLLSTTCIPAKHADQSGNFVLHKFAKAIGRESYSIANQGHDYTLTSNFTFTDRGITVPLQTTFIGQRGSMLPVSYTAKGRSSRISVMDDSVKVEGRELSLTRNGKVETVTAGGEWFVTDGYAPVAMQEQMMRWWLTHGMPAEFTAYPAKTQIHISAAETLRLHGRPMQGYTVAGLIWGNELLWMDDSKNLTALVSTDAEFDHFEAVRAPYENSLGTFIAAAVKANLAALGQLTEAAGAARAAQLAITGATLEDSTGAPPIRDSVILIDHGVITAAGARDKVAIPPHATVLDAVGKYALPGLWDMHAHYEQVEWGPIYLAAGVTSVRDVGNEFEFIRTVRQELNRAEHPAIGPHLEFAGIIDGSGPSSLGAAIADTPAQALAWIEKYKAAGARQIKIYSSVKPEIVKAIAGYAHARGMTVTGHIPDGMTAIEGVTDGMDQINHLQFLLPYFQSAPKSSDGKKDAAPDLDGDRAKELIGVLLGHKTVLDPTVAIYETFWHEGPLDKLEPGVDHLPPQLKEALNSPPRDHEHAEKERKLMQGSLGRLHSAGIPIVAGTDQAIPGYSLHREMELYVASGFTPLEALQAATIEAARAAGVETQSGSLTPGKRGDVLLLDADPLVDIHNSRRVWRTVAAGAVYEPAPLWRSVGFIP